MSGPDDELIGASRQTVDTNQAPRAISRHLCRATIRTVGMSTRGHDTGDAQWFVNLRDNQRLGRDYTVFAEVVDGIDVVDGILEGDTIASIVEVR